MNWFASLFPGSNKQSVRRGQAMSSTHEAFSLPTSSPAGFGPHPDAFNPQALHTPDPMSPSYTYPPTSPVSAYGYVPTSSGSRSRPASLLPLHNVPYTDTTTLPPPYPPLAHTWNRLKTWLAREYPELGDTLNYGILPQDLAQIEMQFGFALPSAVRESYLAVDGQEAESSAGCSDGLFFGLSLLPLEDVLEEWRFWREVDDDPTTSGNPRLRELMQSIPDGWVRKEYSQRGWVPLVVDKAGNYIGVDLNPGEGGQVGQVIVFGRDFDTKVVLWRGEGSGGWAKWLASFVDELESGEGFELGVNNSESEGSEDDLGYEAYFYDGNGRGQGDGGGEAGPGGLRFTGEYRGWSSLEAWADRSVKKWYEAGMIQFVPSPQEKGKGPEKHGLGVLNLADSAAEVPIPVFADTLVEAEPAPALANVTNVASRPPVPAISVTKPPVPLPAAIGLPTTNDMVALPSPPDSTRTSSDDDLEAGLAIGMRELPAESLMSGKRPSSSLASTVELPVSPDVPLSEAARLPEPAPVVDVDLFADPAPTLDTIPIDPESPTKVERPGSSSDPVEAELISPARPSEEADTDENTAADTTIRLVGGGGSFGLVDEEIPPEDVPEPGTELKEVTSITSSGSNDSPSKKDKKHEKRKSSLSSGLKKIGNIGKRKKDSNSSIKETL
ncbi:hypothetical protein BJ138DRAFT_1181649 [Hygrophoropsis aurantiaca]|uniref:Uncharacterized protein n=1 Tax=Hygrophoropsis aurantiaca TaxID=72124 RepID=A0ACB8A6F2_9AGAM|nr:hypothetical protein BJ138DRAFT_1181649 [Hygrophoropsis aurantiaca]